MKLIDADALREHWLANGENEYIYDTNAFLDSIDEQPTVDAAPVVHGRWIHCQGKSKVNKYCRGCGAKMDGGNEDG